MIHRYWLRDKSRNLSKARAYEIFEAPYVTEKAAQLSESNKIVLKVAMDANKIDIKKAFEMVFEIPVESVNTLVSKPRMRLHKGKKFQRASFKKAIIQIKKGFDISKVMGAV